MNFELIKRWTFLLIAAIPGPMVRPEGECWIRQERGLFQVWQLHMG